MRLSRSFLPVLLAAGVSVSASAATISWSPSVSISGPSDISSPGGGVLLAALDFNSGVGFGAGDAMINGIPFVVSGAGGSGVVSTTMAQGPAYDATFSTVASGDADLDALLDSHSWLGGNPTSVSITLNGLTAGFQYQVQLIGVGDERACCAGRIYEPDDGAGNFTTGVTVQRGLNQTTIGTFTADGASQSILWRSLNNATGNNDPGLSGLILFQVPEPGSAALLLIGAFPLLSRRRR